MIISLLQRAHPNATERSSASPDHAICPSINKSAAHFELSFNEACIVTMKRHAPSKPHPSTHPSRHPHINRIVSQGESHIDDPQSKQAIQQPHPPPQCDTNLSSNHHLVSYTFAFSHDFGSAFFLLRQWFIVPSSSRRVAHGIPITSYCLLFFLIFSSPSLFPFLALYPFTFSITRMSFS